MKGHYSRDCPNPAAKRPRTDDARTVAEESGLVIFEEPSNKTVEGPHAKMMEPTGNPHQEEEQANVVRFGGCAILDSGATTGVTSLDAADEVQQQRLSSGELGQPTLSSSDRRFRFGDGSSDSAGKKVTQPITSGILKGQKIVFHLIDKAGNETLPLYPISEMRKTRMVVDY